MTTYSNLGVYDPITRRFKSTVAGDIFDISLGLKTGQILQMVVFKDAEVTLSNNATDNISLAIPAFTPKSTNSRIIIELDADYSITGFGGEEFKTVLFEGTTQIFDKRQRFAPDGGGSTRSPTLTPFIGIYSNSSISPKNFNWKLTRVSGDDVLTVYAYRSVIVTEVQN